MKFHQNKNFKMPKLISIIIPVYNEESCLEDCLHSLKKQSYQNHEIIVVDDGSTDNSIEIAKKCGVKILTQNHKGPGTARNLGASSAKGEILVFVDSDMTFEKNFIKDLTKPIISGITIGTFSKNEFVSNRGNPWSICWNINRNLPPDRMIPKDCPDTSPVFRAIRSKDFFKVKGFGLGGEYTDDWSLSEKLQIKAISVKGAIYYHTNPNTLLDVFGSAKWLATNKFISGNFPRKAKSLIFYSMPFSVVIGLYKSIRYKIPYFIIFKLIFDFAVWVKVINLFLFAKKYK